MSLKGMEVDQSPSQSRKWSSISNLRSSFSSSRKNVHPPLKSIQEASTPEMGDETEGTHFSNVSTSSHGSAESGTDRKKKSMRSSQVLSRRSMYRSFSRRRASCANVKTATATSTKNSLLSVFEGRSVQEVFRYDIILPMTIKAEKERENPLRQRSFVFNYTAYFMYACYCSALLIKSPTPLYGIVVAISVQLLWIVFKWFLYIFDDPELYKNIHFLRGWARYAQKQGSGVFHGHARLMAPALMVMPKATQITTSFCNNMTKKINKNMINNMSAHYRPFRTQQG